MNDSPFQTANLPRQDTSRSVVWRTYKTVLSILGVRRKRQRRSQDGFIAVATAVLSTVMMNRRPGDYQCNHSCTRVLGVE